MESDLLASYLPFELNIFYNLLAVACLAYL